MLDLLNIPKDQRKYIRPNPEDISHKKPNKSLKYYLRAPDYKIQEKKQINTKKPQTPAEFFLKPSKPPKPSKKPPKPSKKDPKPSKKAPKSSKKLPKPPKSAKISPQIQQNNLLYNNWHLFNQNKMMQYKIYTQKQQLNFIISEFIKISDKIKNIDDLFNKKLKELNIQVGGSTIYSQFFEYIRKETSKIENQLESTFNLAKSLNDFIKQLNKSNEIDTKINDFDTKKYDELNDKYKKAVQYQHQLEVTNAELQNEIDILQNEIDILQDFIAKKISENPSLRKLIEDKN